LPLTQEVIFSSTNVLRGNQSVEAFNSKLTHLQLQGRRLGDLKRLDLVHGVYVVYAYDNLITSLSGIEAVRRLQLLYLQNNRLTSMAGIEGLSQLKKLHLGHNRLTVIEGLESATQLEELYVNHQRPTNSTAPLEFDQNSMFAISSSLAVLNAAENRLEDASSLSCLNLTSLDLSDNSFRQVGDLRPLLQGDTLKRILLTGNPLALHERRYRASVVLLARDIEEIDGKSVLPQERDFVRRLDLQKRKLHAQRNKHLIRAGSEAPGLSPTGLSKGAFAGDGPGRASAPPVLQDLVI